MNSHDEDTPCAKSCFDTETTGLDPYQGDRLVEIGCVELLNGFPTGKSFHRYLNPERDMPAEAFEVHGLSAEFLKDKPFFAEVCDEFLAFVGDAPLVAHNAMFDLGFINAELERCKKALIARERLVDTLMLARRSIRADRTGSIDLCARFGIDNSRRTKHGALLDAELLAEVYVELTGARQAQLGLVEAVARRQLAVNGRRRRSRARGRAAARRALTDAERAAHCGLRRDARREGDLEGLSYRAGADACTGGRSAAASARLRCCSAIFWR